MFRAFVVFIEIVLLVATLRTEFMQYWLRDIQYTVSEWMVTIAEIPDQQEIAKLQDNIRPFLGGMSESQLVYLEEITESRNSIQLFNKQYCIDQDMNPFIYGTTLRVVCREINRSPLSSNS
ncbi:hypothetical protein QTP81_14075 [Alteromonas sp. ASW11-36]|uniref:Uncharacterized protein n=1 Tax=Alteromonas arenosi TaxID=3055817 RepID=A0ABT7SZW4_9ALTE|nr:hypothetical protein [Alteromonas sp. ASW11-36]MDM7861725.1 hypothetical protein [Alteromonas sp. ASW11-36]